MRSPLLLLCLSIILISSQATAQNSDIPIKRPSGDPSYYILKRGQSYPINDAGKGEKPIDNSSPAPVPTPKKVIYPGLPATIEDTVPPHAEIGKCYARCIVPEHLEIIEEMVVDKPMTHKNQTIPATYRTVTDTVIVKPAYIRTEDIPATYETILEDVIVSPASQKWVKDTTDIGCLSAHPADCQVLCLREVPALYKKVPHKVIKTPAYKREIHVQAVVRIMSRQIIDQPAHQQQMEIPATYKKISSKQVTRKSGYGEWKEIICPDKIIPGKVLTIQTALKAQGYDPGPLDDIFGPDTKAALIKYQQDKNLPVGNLNVETLKSLGVQ